MICYLISIKMFKMTCYKKRDECFDNIDLVTMCDVRKMAVEIPD